MVVMRLRVEQDLYVAQLEPELFNVRLYQRHRLGKSAVDQDMPLRRGDQERCDLRRPDVVNIANDLERLDRRIPFPVLLRQLRKRTNRE